MRLKNILMAFTIVIVSESQLLSGQRSSVRSIVGSKAVLNCNVDVSGGGHEIFWQDPKEQTLFYNEQKVTADLRISLQRPYAREWNLEIDNVKTSDSGTYTCKIKIGQLEQNKLVHLEVVVPPRIKAKSGNVEVSIGDEAILTCEATGTPAPAISWYRIVSDQRRDLQVTGNSYTLRATDKSIAGTYECEADNNVPPPSMASIQVDVLFAPEVSLPYMELNQEEGKNTLLECIAYSNPLTEHYWQKDGIKLTSSKKYTIDTRHVGQYTQVLSAFILNLDSDDYGKYECVAQNNYGVKTAILSLYKWDTGLSKVLVTPVDVLAFVGGDALMRCTVDHLRDGDSLTWWHNSPVSGARKIFVSHPGHDQDNTQIIFNRSRYEIQGVYDLLLKNLSLMDAGEYVCEVTRLQNTSATLTVLDGIECNLTKARVLESATIHTLCTLNYQGQLFDINVEWLHDSEIVTTSAVNHSQQLMRFLDLNATLDHSGVYKCKAWSEQHKMATSCETVVVVDNSARTTTQANTKPTSSPIEDKKDDADMSFVVTMLSVFLTLLILLYVITVCALVIYYRQKMHSLRLQGLPLKYRNDKNGGMGSETDALTAAEKKAAEA